MEKTFAYGTSWQNSARSSIALVYESMVLTPPSLTLASDYVKGVRYRLCYLIALYMTLQKRLRLLGRVY